MEFHTRDGMTQADAFAESFAHVDMAEQLGLDAVWLAEAHFAPSRSVLSSPFMLAAAIAARTNRIKVGTAVLLLPLGNPLRIAEEATTLDHVSKGRFEFGVGRSGLPGAYEGYNISYAESKDRFFEYLDIILTSWDHRALFLSGQLLLLRRCLPHPQTLPRTPSPHPHRRHHLGHLPCHWADGLPPLRGHQDSARPGRRPAGAELHPGLGGGRAR